MFILHINKYITVCKIVHVCMSANEGLCQCKQHFVIAYTYSLCFLQKTLIKIFKKFLN